MISLITEDNFKLRDKGVERDKRVMQITPYLFISFNSFIS
jgi:hypothetical protein